MGVWLKSLLKQGFHVMNRPCILLREQLKAGCAFANALVMVDLPTPTVPAIVMTALFGILYFFRKFMWLYSFLQGNLYLDDYRVQVIPIPNEV